MRHYIGQLEDFPEGAATIITVEGRSIGVYNLKGELYALRNLCPHQGAPLCIGHITPWVSAPEPYHFVYEREGEIVRCPWHQWEFEIKTGKLVVDPKYRTKSYDVYVERYELSVQDSKVYIEL